MNPLPVVLTGVVVAVVPPLRRRVVPIARAVTVGALEVGVTAALVAKDVVSTAVTGEQPG